MAGRGREAGIELVRLSTCPHIGYLLTGATIGAGPGSVEVFGGTFSQRLSTAVWWDSLMACVLAGHRGAERLKRGLPCSK
jgi:hypothetical protein